MKIILAVNALAAMMILVGVGYDFWRDGVTWVTFALAVVGVCNALVCCAIVSSLTRGDV